MKMWADDLSRLRMWKAQLDAWGYEHDSHSCDTEYLICTLLLQQRKTQGKRTTSFMLGGKHERSERNLKRYIKDSGLSDKEFLKRAKDEISMQTLLCQRNVRAFTPESEVIEPSLEHNRRQLGS